MPELRLLDPNGYVVPEGRITITPTTEPKARADLRALAIDHAGRYAHAGYDHRNYRIITTPEGLR
ncbi:hypothetical protein PV677_36325 [Streptomyces sp. DE06-01C]|uniref:hypothetical protein n=1 Tax=Streptomyces sp. DE06-01C TaxID=3028656 RepID=UPI0029C331C9|nr:hypothetical protein [Streptomyces sp. DE06-01C]MDX5526138.1 hypothetical protein [Streptomyces sp. DE06-01C]